MRDLFRAAEQAGGIANVDDRAAAPQPPHIVPETKDLAALLREFRRTKEHMAIVVDEYGAMEGIATLEDLLEEIVGEIEDEFDLPDESVEHVDDEADPHRRDVPDRRLQRGVPGRRCPRRTTTRSPASSSDELGHAPHEGDTVEHDGVRFTVIETNGSRIERLEVEFQRTGHRGGHEDEHPPADDSEPAEPA